MTERTERRLAAIVSADVVGYSRLMGIDEVGTHARLKARFSELVMPKITEYGGRVVKLMGDGLLAEFPSVINAVNWAVEMQIAIAEQDAPAGNEDRIEYRVGINLGDIIVDGDDIFGDGVNVAARLQEIALPGGIVISGNAQEQIRDKLDHVFTDDGVHKVKNIARPVQVWRWSPAGSSMSIAPDTGDDDALPLPDKPSIAVLPFDNMSGDPEQEYFSDGMTEDIITALSRLRWLFVTARNSTFTYRGRAVDVKQVGREMGVKYVLEGSVRRAANRVRVTVQLIEADTGNHIWADRYDRDLVDIFDLQDELAEAIGGQVNAELAASERQQAHRKRTTDLGAWELYQRGMWHNCKFSRKDMVEARRLFQLASERAPEFAIAHAGLAVIAHNEVVYGYAKDKAATLEQGLRDAERAVALDDQDSYSLYALGRVCMLLGDSERSISASEKSISLNPSSALAYYGLGWALHWFGRPQEAKPMLARAIRLSPHEPALWAFHLWRSWAHAELDELDLAIIDAKAAIQAKNDRFMPYLLLAYVHSLLGRIDDARAAYDRAFKINPEISATYLKSIYGTMHPPYLEKFFDALRQAGLPEE